MGDAAARVHSDLGKLQEQQINRAREVAGTLHNDLRAVEQQGREVQRVLTSEWKQVLAETVAGLRTLQTETSQSQAQIRENLRNVCEALRNLVVRLDQARPTLDDIKATVGKVQMVVDPHTLASNGGHDDDPLAKQRRRWWLLGARR